MIGNTAPVREAVGLRDIGACCPRGFDGTRTGDETSRYRPSPMSEQLPLSLAAGFSGRERSSSFRGRRSAADAPPRSRRSDVLPSTCTPTVFRACAVCTTPNRRSSSDWWRTQDDRVGSRGCYEGRRAPTIRRFCVAVDVVHGTEPRKGTRSTDGGLEKGGFGACGLNRSCASASLVHRPSPHAPPPRLVSTGSNESRRDALPPRSRLSRPSDASSSG